MPQTSVGMIGLGLMGSAMTASLIRAGYNVIGYDVLAARRKEHRRSGGVAAANVRDVVKRSTIIITSLPSSDALLETAVEIASGSWQSRDGGSKEQDPPYKIVIETSTLPIAIKEQARKTLRAHGVTLLDCPLSGTAAQARAKDVVVYASGIRAAYRRVAPIMDAFARAHYYVGAFGAGSRMKFVANLLVAIHNVAAAEALVLAMKAGLDPAMVLEVIGAGAGSSRMFQVRGPMMVRGKYADAMMKLGVWEKDLNLIAEFARKVACPTPLFSATVPLYAAAAKRRPQTDDTASVCAILEEMAGLRRSKVTSRKLQVDK